MARNNYGDPRHYLAPYADAVTVTNTTTQTVSATVTLEGDSLALDSRIIISGDALCVSTNSTDTHQIIVELGTSGGTLVDVITSTAVDTADNDVCRFEGELVVAALGADGTGSLVGYGRSLWSTGSAVDTVVNVANATNIDTVDPIVITANVKMSVAHADNQTKVRNLRVTVIPGQS